MRQQPLNILLLQVVVAGVVMLQAEAALVDIEQQQDFL
jgi:hypothetical protein